MESDRRIAADVISAGGHGYGFSSRLLMWSTSTARLREAACSILIAYPHDDHMERQSASPPAGRAT
jgi:nucleotide-binding universal stress UspA family protein